jgi:nucleoside-diphosphate-sugar epimerase
MQLLVTGSMGTLGRKVMRAFPGSIGLDVRHGADIVGDLATIAYARGEIARALASVDALVHLATSPDPNAPDAVHWQAVANASRLLQACQAVGLTNVVLASSDWAQPKGPGATINTYGHSKRVFEAMAAMFSSTPGRRGVALRIGWVPACTSDLDGAPEWLRANYWDDARLIAELRTALGF